MRAQILEVTEKAEAISPIAIKQIINFIIVFQIIFKQLLNLFVGSIKLIIFAEMQNKT
jgi:hypothetical protein